MTSARLSQPQAAESPARNAAVQPAPPVLLIAIALATAFLATPPAQAQMYSVVHNFAGGRDGISPNGNLIHDAAGNLYGTTNHGGSSNQAGTVFRLSPTAVMTTLYAFTGKLDGGEPAAPLSRDSAGNLYGTTVVGGDPVCNCGTVFKLDTHHVLTVLHTFKGGTDGAHPLFGVISVGGQLYGTTAYGGTGCPGFGGCGVIFKLTGSGAYRVLYRFTGKADGSEPQALVRDLAGNLYGAAYSTTSNATLGTIFELDLSGRLTVLYAFPGGSAGAFPRGRVGVDASGTIRGVTQSGGDPICDCGVVYELGAAANEIVMHTFFGAGGGEFPEQGLLDVNGAFYGMTANGGDLTCNPHFGCGLLFQIGNTGAYTVLQRFSGGADGGGFPIGELTLNTDSSIYGATAEGGTGSKCPGGCGVIFKYTP